LKLTGKHRFGLYLISVGENSVKYQDNEDRGLDYRLMASALINRNLFTFEGSRALTDSSFRNGSENELDFFQNQLLWTTQVSLTHQYTMKDDRLSSVNNIYFNLDESIGTTSTKQNTQNAGFSSQLDWKIDEQWTLLASASYRHSELYTGRQKQLIETSLSGRLNVTQSLYLQMSVNWENEEFTDTGIGYDETTCITRIAYTF